MRNVKNLSLSVLILTLACNTIVASTHYVYPGDSIQNAIDAAVDGDTVMVAAGNYYENLTWEYKSINLIGAGAGQTIINGDIDHDGVPGPGRCLYMSNVPETAIIEGFTFTGGAADRGGGLSLYSCSLMLTKNTITGNSVSLYGGGLFLHDSPVTLTNNSITNNETTVYSQYYGGGGIFVAHSSSPTITNNIIADNSTERHGGGLYLSGGSTAIVTGNSITDNFATVSGGGVCIRNSSPDLSNNNIAHNSTQSQNGGGGIMWMGQTSGNLISNTIISNSNNGVALSYASPTVTMNTFTDNSDKGLRMSGSSSTVTRNIFTGNSGNGAAIYVIGRYDLWVNPVISNNLMVRNRGGLGGGILLEAWSTVEVINNTFVTNSSGLGGAIYIGSDGYHNIINNIMAGNTSSETWGGGAIFANGGIHKPYINYNDLWNNTLPHYGQIGGHAEDIEADPLFVDPTSGDYHLQADSPCIDTGDNSSVPSGIVTDFDGNPRIVNGIVDMGAFEALDDPMVMLDQLKTYIQQQVALGNIDVEIETSLLAKVDAALSALDRGNPNNAKVAMNDLKALINQVEAQTGKKITADTAVEIIRLANEIIEELGD